MANPKDRLGWGDEDTYWRSNYRNRPVRVVGRQGLRLLSAGVSVRLDAANRYQGREWDEVEPDLSRDWNTYGYRGTSTWQQIKDAVRDAWDRVTGNRPVGTRH